MLMARYRYLPTYSSISMTAVGLPCFMYSMTELARPKMFGFPPRPRQIPHTIVDFPVPFAPTTTFSPGPGKISTLE